MRDSSSPPSTSIVHHPRLATTRLLSQHAVEPHIATFPHSHSHSAARLPPSLSVTVCDCRSGQGHQAHHSPQHDRDRRPARLEGRVRVRCVRRTQAVHEDGVLRVVRHSLTSGEESAG